MARLSFDAATLDGVVCVLNGKKQPVRKNRVAVHPEDDDQPITNESPAITILKGLDPFSDPLLMAVVVFGMSYGDLAAADGCDRSTIHRRYWKRLKQLREQIEKRFNVSDDDGDAAGIPARPRKARPSGHRGFSLAATVV